MQPNPNLLNQLHDIQLPDPVGWWPLTFSWWILIFSITSVLVGIVWYYLEQKRRNIYRQSALQKIDEILQRESLSDNEKIAAINAVVKRVALTAFGRLSTAHLHDQEWLEFLHETASYIPQPKELQGVLDLAYQPDKHSKNYQPNKKINLNAHQALEIWQDYAKKWVKGHHQ
jgi:cbb3-type cytochrome oxidase subunit 3